MKTNGSNEPDDFDFSSVPDAYDDRIMRLPEVMRATGHCRSSIYKLLKEDRFPKQRKIGKRAVGWSRRDIQIYIQVTLAGGEYRASVYQRSDPCAPSRAVGQASLLRSLVAVRG